MKWIKLLSDMLGWTVASRKSQLALYIFAATVAAVGSRS